MVRTMELIYTISAIATMRSLNRWPTVVIYKAKRTDWCHITKQRHLQRFEAYTKAHN